MIPREIVHLAPDLSHACGSLRPAYLRFGVDSGAGAAIPTARLKTGAISRNQKSKSWARRVFRPTDAGSDRKRLTLQNITHHLPNPD
jgi:hypothetical protein